MWKATIQQYHGWKRDSRGGLRQSLVLPKADRRSNKIDLHIADTVALGDGMYKDDLRAHFDVLQRRYGIIKVP